MLVVRSTKVTRPMLEKGNLSLVVRAGAGYNTIDVEAASERGIWVANCPGKNAIAVAELTFGLMLALDRRIVERHDDLRAGKWNKKEYSKARGLFGRTLGVLGAGTIGREVIAPRAGVRHARRRVEPRSSTQRRRGARRRRSSPTPIEVAAASDVLTRPPRARRPRRAASSATASSRR